MNPSGLESLIEALRCLPGVGPKSAQRMAYHLLQRDRAGAQRLGDSVLHALQAIRHCQRCNTFTEADICERCLSPRRDPSLLCVVETPVDMNMMEQTLSYQGLYYVLMGRLSPLDGVGPRELGLDRLMNRALDGVVREVIHIPDNAGVGDSLTGVFYQFKTNGAYVAGNGSNNTEAKWYWIEEGVKFKVDYEGQLPANDIYTILNMNDSLLHATLRDEGEPDTTGNYWEIKYRPN